MISDNSITVGIFEGFSWIRCEGKGSFMNSPVLKEFGDARIRAGEPLLVVDLSACSGMDSTFMGTLAGMSARLTDLHGGILQIADPGSRNLHSLEDLGLDHLMEIDPADAPWREMVSQIREQLCVPGEAGAMSIHQRKRHVLESHMHLAEINDRNAKEFSDVVNHLKREIGEAPGESQGS